MLDRDIIVKELLTKIHGQLSLGSKMEELAFKAYDMGVDYAHTKKFDNSRHYHNYQFRLDDGTKALSSNFFNQFTTRNQTGAYMDAEKYVGEYFDDSDQTLFHMVRDKRFGINGVFKAVMSPSEPQQINYNDYVLIIACFCAGFMSNK